MTETESNTINYFIAEPSKEADMDRSAKITKVIP